jgi:hypothetical protein
MKLGKGLKGEDTNDIFHRGILTGFSLLIFIARRPKVVNSLSVERDQICSFEDFLKQIRSGRTFKRDIQSIVW